MMIQRKNLTMFMDAKDNILVNKLKDMIGCMHTFFILSLGF